MSDDNESSFPESVKIARAHANRNQCAQNLAEDEAEDKKKRKKEGKIENIKKKEI